MTITVTREMITWVAIGFFGALLFLSAYIFWCIRNNWGDKL
jgi:hypothetical protein